MANEGSLVSVIVPYHNEGELLTRALASIAEQTHRGPIEVVVVDDASEVRPAVPDGLGMPVRLVRAERNLYAGGARNLGIRESRGEFVAFLDADDVYLPEKLRS